MSGTSMKNSDVRAYVLRRFYDQEMSGQHRSVDPGEIGEALGVPRRQVEVAFKYLVDMGLLNGHYVLGTDVPLILGITALGMDVVDNPAKFADIEINQQIVQVSGGTIYGPIAQAQGKSQVVQTVGDVRAEVDKHGEVPEEERESIKKSLGDLEQLLSQDHVSQSRLKQILASLKKYDWLYSLVIEIVKSAFTR